MLRIKDLAKEKGYTITGLAEKMGMTQVSLSRIINGNPTIETLEKISEALGVHIQDLFKVKPSDQTRLYIKHGEKFVEVGTLDTSKLG